MYMGRKLTTDNFIRRSQMIYGDKYDYSKVRYTGYKSKVAIICSIHGEFQKTPNDFLNESGCRLCGIKDSAKTRQSSLSEFIQKAQSVHGYVYDYSTVRYINSRTKIDIICRIHGKFQQTPNNHLSQKHRCPSCAAIGISKPEIQWLDSLQIETLEKQRRLLINGRYYKPDGYDPVTNTVYEFWGDFWHGNPKLYNANDINPKNKKSFGVLYNNTLRKIQRYKEHGYNIEYIWESDFK